MEKCLRHVIRTKDVCLVISYQVFCGKNMFLHGPRAIFSWKKKIRQNAHKILCGIDVEFFLSSRKAQTSEFRLASYLQATKRNDLRTI